MINIGTLQLSVLDAVQALQAEAYGVRIQERLVEQSDDDIHMPQVYRALKRLEALGYLTSRQAHRPGRGRTRRLYTLTAPAVQLMAATAELNGGDRQ